MENLELIVAIIFLRCHEGEPWGNLQIDGKMAKPYQVKQVLKALKRLEESDL